MNKNPTTCEDCLSLLTGIEIPRETYSKRYSDYGYIINKTDATILVSIAKQLSKKIAMTDRQYDLVQSKLLEYKDQFNHNGIDIEALSKVLKYELREIDRSHWVKIMTYEGTEMIGIRFPFNKKIIDRLEDLRKISNLGVRKKIVKQNNTHFFPLDTQSLFNVVKIAKRFEHKFDIQPDILEAYALLEEFNENRDKYIPGVYNGEVRNISHLAKEGLIAECENNLALYYDRRFKYGLIHFDENIAQSYFHFSSLSKKIITRQENSVVWNNLENINFNEFVHSLFELNRFPVLIVLDEKEAHDDLVSTYNSFRHVLKNEEISVLFRKDGKDPFNQYVHDNKLNNPVDKNTKVVYISNNKLPKPLLQTDWTHRTVMLIRPRGLGYNNVTKYVQSCDCLIICEDKSRSGYFNRSSRKFVYASS